MPFINSDWHQLQWDFAGPRWKVLGLKKYFPMKYFLSYVMDSKPDLKGIFSFYDMWYAIFSWNEINEPNVQACFLGCNQAQESPRLEQTPLQNYQRDYFRKVCLVWLVKYFMLFLIATLYSLEWFQLYIVSQGLPMGRMKLASDFWILQGQGAGPQSFLPGEHECLITVAVPAAIGWMTEMMAVPLEYHLPLPAKPATILYSPPLTGW